MVLFSSSIGSSSTMLRSDITGVESEVELDDPACKNLREVPFWGGVLKPTILSCSEEILRKEQTRSMKLTGLLSERNSSRFAGIPAERKRELT